MRKFAFPFYFLSLLLFSQFAFAQTIGGTATGDDFDGDGIINSVDIDDDNDGVSDKVECNPSAKKILFAGSSEDFSTMRSSLFAEFSNNLAAGGTIVQSNIIQTVTVPAGFYDGYDMVIFGGAAFETIHANHWAALQTAIQNKTSKAFIIESDNCCVAANQSGLVNLLNNVFGTSYARSSTNPAVDQTFTLNGTNSYASVFTTNSLTGNNYYPILNVAASDILFYSPSVAGSALAGMKQLPGTTDKNRFVAWFVDGTITQGAPWYTTNRNKIAPAFYNAFNATAPLDCDTDNDGVYNVHDLDSDGDNCPDAKEAGVTGSLNAGSVKNGNNGSVSSTTTLPDALAAGSVGANGLVDLLETVTDNGVISYFNKYASYALGKNVSVCADTDTDGVLDLVDIDDDNDGILDVIESPYCFYTASEWLSGNRSDIQVTTTLAMNATYKHPNELVDGDGGTTGTSYAVNFNASTTAAQTVYSFKMPVPVELKTIYLGYYNASTHFNSNTVLRLEGSNDNVSWSTLGNGYAAVTSVPGVSGTINANSFAVSQNSGNYLYYRIYWVSGGGVNAAGYSNEVYFETLPNYQASLNPKAICTNDTDVDGKLNHHDLDADGDGCSDALEAGASSSTTANFTFTGTMGANGLDNSLETAVDNGLLNYTPTYNFAKANSYAVCLDSDGDSVTDLIDIDDDNDGVLDSEECPPFNINSLSYAPAAYSVTNGASASQTFPAAPAGLVVNVFTLDNSFNVRINGTHLTNPQELQFWTSAPTDALFEFLDGTAYSAVWGIVGNKNKPLIRVYIDQVGRIKVYGSRTSGGALEEMRLRNGSFNTIDLNTTSTNTFQIGQAVVAQTFISGDYGVIVPPSCDDDNDGIPNGLDLDSDGDGCPDAKEAGVSGTLLSGNVKNGANGAVTSTTNLPDAVAGSAGNYGANGLANVVETSTESGVVSYTSTYAANARSRTQNGCLEAVTDTDSDGVLDVVDIDDDNDGVLDSIEQNGCYGLGANLSTLTFSGGAVTAKTMNTITSSNTNSWNSSYSTQDFALPLSFKFKRPTVGNTAMFGLLPAYGTQTPVGYADDGYRFYFTSTNVQVPFGTTYNVTQTATAQDEYSVDISATGYVIIKINGIQKAAFQGVNSAYKISVAGLTTTVFTDIRLSNPANPLVTICPDTDNDGLPNYLDLDSDGDGCSDAKEAGIATGLNAGVLVNKVNNTTTNTTVSDAIVGTSGNYGANGFANVIETSTESGTYSGTYTYEYATSSSIKACLDTDGDGVMNDLDIDDDNDGILDKEECEIKTFYWTSPYTRDGSNVVGTINNIPFTYSSTTGISLTGDVFNYAYFPASYGMPNTDPAIRNSSINTNTLTFSQPVTNPVFVFASVGDGATTVPITFSKPVELEWGRSNSAISFTNSTTISSNEGYLIVRIPGIHSSVSFTYSVAESWSNYVLGYQQSTYCDTDGDGITNNLDLDSDGDNCPDAVEAGVTSLPASGITGAARLTASQISGNYGSNGFADVLETAAGSGIYSGTYNYNYAINSTVNACTDTDSDSTSDLFDLDDDNDGVLDSVEENCVISAVSKTGLIITKPAGITYTFNSNAITNLIDGADSPALVAYNPLGTTSLSPWLNFEFPTPKTLTSLEIAHHNATPLFSLNSTYKIQASSDNVNWKDLSGVLTYTSVATSSSGGSATNFSNIADISSNRTAYKYYRFYGISGRSGGGWATEIYFKDVSCASDVDGDGIPNMRDLDSDGDGCSDAIEAGSSTSSTSTSVYPTGTDNNANGLLNDYEGSTNGTINYASTYAGYSLVSSINVCLDTDGDGKGDIIDIDDDNDGVLDVTEYNCEVATMSKTGITVSSTVSWGYNGTTLNNLVNGTEDLTAYTTGDFLNQTILQFNLPTAKVLEQIEISTQSGLTTLGTTGTYNLEGWNGTAWVIVEKNKTFGSPSAPIRAPGNTYKFLMPNNLTAYTKYRIFGTSAKGTFNSSSWIQEAYFFERACNTDIDNDGIKNWLDTDSDGDSCPDAVESGTTAIGTSGVASNARLSASTIPAPYSSNGFATGLETTAGNGIYKGIYTYNMAADASVNACTDTDNDGIVNAIDLDDDNDGVLDATELNCAIAIVAKTGITVSSTVTWGYSSSTLANLINGLEDLTAYSTSDFIDQTILQFDFTSAKTLNLIEISTQNSGTTLGTTGKYNVQGWNGTKWINILTNQTFALTAPVLAPANSYTIKMPFNTTAYTKYRIFGTSTKGTVSTTTWIQEAYFTEQSCNLDTDGDGTPNTLDTDSDGDGCSDAVEAGTVTGTTATTVAGTYDANGFANSLETATESGIYSGTYTYQLASDRTFSACSDTDGDGVTDVNDVDDDNDGILDSIECPATELISNGNFANGTAGWTVGTGWTLINGAMANFDDGSNNVKLRQTIGRPYPTTRPGYVDFKVDVKATGYNNVPSNGYTASITMQVNGNKYAVLTNPDNNTTTATIQVFNGALSSLSTFPVQLSSGPFTTVTISIPSHVFFASNSMEIGFSAGYDDFYIDNISVSSSPNLAACDTDGDGIPNSRDLDTDGDGCSDANEAYNSSTAQGTDGNSYYGTGNPPAVDASGKVTGASYAGTNANVTTAGTASVITAQPLDAGVSPGATATFTATVTAGSAPAAYQWQLSTDGGTTWANVTNTAPYSGATTAALTVTNVTMSMKGYSYKLVITQANYVCGTVVSNPAKIEITPFASIVDDAITAAEDTVVTGNVLTNDTGSGNTTLTLTTFKIGATTYNAGDTATIVGVGTLRVNSYGSFTFTPEQNYIGTVPTVEYTATDTAGASDSGTLSIVITPTNDAPGATDEGINVTEDTPFSGNVLSNDTDPEGNTLVVSTFSTTINGVVVTFNVGDTAAIPGVGTILVNANGSFTFTPALNYIGTVPDVNYTISDGNGGSDTGKLTISINPVNDAPLAADDIVVTPEDIPVSGNVLTNDTDLEGNNLSVTQFNINGTNYPAGTTTTIAGVGTVVVNSNGTFTFSPVLNYTGNVPDITYTVSDGNTTDTGVLDLFVAPVNDPPAGNNDTKTVDEDAPATGNVLSNDTDTDTPLVDLEVTQITFTVGGTTYTYPAGTTATIPGVGIVVVNTNGTYTFTPNSNWNGTVPVITYTLSDGEGGTDTATLAITVNAVNDNPITVNDDNKVTPEDTPISGNVLTNDSDPEGISISVSQFTINGTNYPAGTTATITGVGTLIIGTNGSFTFTPAANYSGAVPTVTYTAVDASGGTGTATLKLAVTPVNDTPVAVDDTVATPEGSAATGNVVTNDTDIENNTKSVTGFEINGITYQVGTLVTIPNKGTLLLNADGTYTFTPVANYSGALPAITYTVSDGNGGTDTADLLITVTAVNDAPVVVNENVSTPEDSPLTGNVLTNDSDIEGNTLSVTQFTVGGQSYAVGLTATIAGVGTIRVNADGTFIFTPEANYNGAVPAIGYKVSDGTSIVDGSLNITVSPVNDAPIARNNTETSSINTVANGNVLTNDSDIEGNALTVTQFTLIINNVVTTFNDGDTATIPGVGTLVINEDGSYTFTPETNYYGTVPVATYTVSDGTLTATATLTLNVTAPDTDGDGVYDFKETLDGTDPNNFCDYKSTSVVSGIATGAWRAADCDGDGTSNGTDTAPLDPCVHAVNAQADRTNALWQAADCDNDGETNGFEDANGTNPSNGCSFTTAPTASSSIYSTWAALDCDNDGLTNGAEVSGGTDPLNPDTDGDGNPDNTDTRKTVPTATNDTANASVGTATVVNILANDDYLANDGNTITQTGGTATGTVSFNPVTGQMSYTPTNAEGGTTITVVYEVCQGNVCATATVTITVAINDSDGDGVSDSDETTDGTSPTNPCDYNPSSQNSANTSTAWRAADCDGDGTPNGTDTDPLDPCVNNGTSTPVTTNTIWQAADCDGDGITNATEGVTDIDNDGTPDYKDLDSDGDGIPDAVDKGSGSSPVDSDNDGTPDYKDVDSDGDGISDSIEDSGCTGTTPCTPTDSDSDGTPDYLDLDSDGDGISDAIEKGPNATPVDTDNDGTPDYLDLDSDGDGISDTIEKGSGSTPLDTDNDGTPDFKDLDSDNDGITDAIEKGSGSNPVDTDSNGTPDYRDLDSDGDGISDTIEKGSGSTPIDTDNDGTPDFQDTDSDNDGISDTIEKGSGTSAVDTDNDGTPDYRDTDSDNDGITDAIEKGSGSTPIDTDSDGTPDYKDLDSDGDGKTDAQEGSIDTDGDGTPNFQDLDSDGDGVLDSVDQCPLVVGTVAANGCPADFDGDGLDDVNDLDDDNDGIIDTLEAAACTPANLNCDTDGDGIPNRLDSDSDNDGISDVKEAGGIDTDNDGRVDGGVDVNGVPTSANGGITPPNTDGTGGSNPYDIDSDGDGIPDSMEKGVNGNNPVDTDGDTIPDYLDLDSDGDGIVDAIEKGLNGTTPLDTDADGTPDYKDLDSDNDGISDAIEKGTGTTPIDTDGDGTPDYRDTDSDNDGITDAIEKGPSATPVDTDNDGTPDYRDLDSDNDGISDAIEKGSDTTPVDTDSDGTPDYKDLDSDGDGITDAIEKGTGTTPADTDGDGTPDFKDTDSDNDGISDAIEKGPTASPVDTDGDGTPDYRDLDSDNDGILDSVEKGTGSTPLDTDNDGTPDFRDLDSDNDGIPDNQEGVVDTDGDGTPDYKDLDSDGDGVLDTNDQCPLVVGTVQMNGCPTDFDGDGIVDTADLDDDNDGILDTVEAAACSPVDPNCDTDGDGIPNRYDADSDNDGIKDTIEAGVVDANNDGKADGGVDADGVPLSTNGGKTPPDTDGDGQPNPYDVDSDGDGISDAIEKGANGANPVDTDGDGTPDYLDLDSDNDGIPDAVEKGTGSSILDTDGDGTPDYRDLDSDNDGITDAIEKGPNGATPLDTDNDGTPDYRDLDSDNDGISDAVEKGSGTSPLDTDNDGTPDYREVDSDNDGISDAIEKGSSATPVDTDSDGTPDYRDLDSDNDGITDSVEKGSATTPLDTDSDGTPDYRDLDSDNDGIPDSVEKGSGTTPLDTDSDGTPDYRDLDSDNDGISDAIEKGTNGLNPVDTDGDGIPDYKDTDSDNDGIPDSVEKGPNSATPLDTDGDGTPDYRDLDSDNDGITDAIEKGPNGATPLDTDSDGSPDYRDTDSDGDNKPDNQEGLTDTDGDGIPNYRDTDSDNDSVLDINDQCPYVEGTVVLNGCPPDSDNDGFPENIDLDDDNDGILDTIENGICSPTSINCDTDGDGIPNRLDPDSDNDGISDVIETNRADGNGDGKDDGSVDANGIPQSSNGGVTPPNTDGDANSNPYDLDSDGDGIPDAIEKGANGNAPVDTDGDGTPDYLDLDSDNDGIPDTIEKGTGSSILDTDGDGTPDYKDVDSDNDGISDVIEKGTNGVNPVDTDGDGIPDYRDLDSDNDGIIDAIEKGSNGATPVDTDGDGTPDYRDIDSDGDGVRDFEDDCPLIVGIAALHGCSGIDSDNDGIPDAIDLDDDNDGILDVVENAACTPSSANCDTDGDGIINSLDLDSDNDGITDARESNGTDANGDGKIDGAVNANGVPTASNGGTTPPDTDGDGKRNPYDVDSDGDGISDSLEKGSNPNTPVDTDNDGTPDYLDLDSDNDGISDAIEKGSGATPVDTDNDGTPDYLDLDSDNDGISDAIEKGSGATPVDTDNDGTPDYLDLDSDNDGISDAIEKGSTATPVDTDSDGIPDYIDLDSDGDGISDAIEKGSGATLVDTDNDGTPDYRDLDSDNDGISDAIEKGSTATPVDTDSDGTPDYLDLDSDNDGISDAIEKGSGTTPVDTDNDGTPDYRDLDSDGDGITDAIEKGSGTTPVDTDNDGTPDYRDLDSDNDGITDAIEKGSTATPVDTDNDGTPDYRDLDSDNDGITDAIEKGSTATPVDTDSDGIPDYIDLDSDGDGISDAIEKGSGATPVDTDNDGTPDYRDLDSDNDGISDAIEKGSTATPVDTDSDGTPDYLDLDSDNDGISDAIEKGSGTTPVDTDNDGTPDYRDLDSDGDGITDAIEKGSGTTPVDTDNDGTPDYLDLDSDNDGITDAIEKGSTAIPVDTDNDSTPDYRDLDSDNDGISDAIEKGSTATPVDTDSDGTPDYRDLDSDNDGITDTIEKGSTATPVDTDNDGTPDYLDLDSDNDGISDTIEKGSTAAPVDTDNDGTPDYRDLDSDNDGSSDAVEKGPNGNNPIDTDGDGIPDYRDLPTITVVDTDGDGVIDSQELIDGTDPKNSCSSNPMSITLPLAQAFLTGDCDSDGLTNAQEIGSNPKIPTDEDNNGILDYLQFNNHVSVDDDLEIFNSMTVNGDGLNDVFVIRGIDQYPNNTVTIYNRWGIEVYKEDGYGQDNKFFRGISEGRVTISQSAELPKGTYFYIVRYVNKEAVEKQRSGYLYITK